MDESSYYQIILNSVSEQVYVRDLEKNILYINPAAEKLTKWTLEEAKKKKCYEIFGDENQSCKDICPVERVISENHSVLHHEGELKTRDGDIRKMRVSISPMHSGQDVVGGVVVMQDVTDLKALEDTHVKTLIKLEKEVQLRESSEARLEQAQSVAGVGSWHFDIVKNNLIWSDETYRLFDIDKNQPIDLGLFLECVHDDDKDLLLAEWKRAIREGTYDIEHRIQVDGKIRWVRERAKITFDEYGAAILGIGTVHDITERKYAELALAEERNMFLEGPTLVMKWKVSHRPVIEYISPNVLQVLGYPPEEIMANKWSFRELIHSDDYDNVSVSVRKGIRDGAESIAHKPYRIKRKDGSYGWFADYTRIVRNYKGDVSHFQGYLVDITDKHEIEERLDLAIKGSQVGLWDWSIKTGMLVVNERWAEIVGYSLEEIEPASYQTFVDLCRPDDLKKANFVLERHFNGETEIFESEIRLRQKSGNWIWVLNKGKIVEWDENGDPVRMIGTHFDINELKVLQEFVQSESDMAAAWSMATSFESKLEECLNTALSVANMDGGGLYLVNEYDGGVELKVQRGLSEDFIKNTSYYPIDSENARIIDKGDPVYIIANKEVSVKEGIKAIGIIPIVNQGKSLGSLNVASRSFDEIPDLAKNALERIAHYAGSFITQEMNEERNRQHHKDLELLFNTIDDMFFILDIEGFIIGVNEVVTERLGYTEDELLGKHILFVHPKERHEDAKRVIGAMIEGKEDSCIIPLLTKSGNHIPVETKVVIGKWQNKQVIFGISRDITERLELERRAQQTVKAESLSRMAGAIAHHFNNKLSAVIGNLELVLIDSEPDWDGFESIVDARAAAFQASEVSRNLLVFLGETDAEPSRVSLSKTCRLYIEQLMPQLPLGISLMIDFPDKGPYINADPVQVGQVLTVLVTNAWEAMGESPGEIRIEIKTVTSGDIELSHCSPVGWEANDETYACIVVNDRGHGMDEETISRIFDPFFTKKFLGRGLGLAVTLGIVKSFGGCITVSSIIDKGSTVRIYWPLSEKETESKKSEIDQIATEAYEGKTVLLVEDEIAVSKVVGNMLNRLGFTVYSAEDGPEAIELFRDEHDSIDLILTDLAMPNMNGWKLLELVREIKPDIPAILASGYEQSQIMDEQQETLIQAFLQKPFSLNNLKDALYSAFHESRTP